MAGGMTEPPAASPARRGATEAAKYINKAAHKMKKREEREEREEQLAVRLEPLLHLYAASLQEVPNPAAVRAELRRVAKDPEKVAELHEQSRSLLHDWLCRHGRCESLTAARAFTDLCAALAAADMLPTDARKVIRRGAAEAARMLEHGGRRGPLDDWAFAQLIAQLATVYERATGKRASPHRAFVEFVQEALAPVEPGRAGNNLESAIKLALRKRSDYQKRFQPAVSKTYNQSN